MEKNHNITVYSTSSCPYCSLTKDFLKGRGVVFTDLNVGENIQAAEEMVKKSGQMGVPVIDIDGKIIVGYRPEVFDKLLS
jgi:glutaredoxin-like YruB-family protein